MMKNTFSSSTATATSLRTATSMMKIIDDEEYVYSATSMNS